jgi:hypothetical protein
MNTAVFSRLCGTLLPVILVALLVTGPGCRLTKSKHETSAQMRTRAQATVSQNQLRLRMRALVQPMCGELEQAADAIIAGTTNRVVQQAALRWKIEGVPALREALFQPDPYTAGMDTWVLCNQMADYFENGPGKESLGVASVQATATCRRMEEEFTQVAASIIVSEDVSRTRAYARKWASEHPIHYSIAARESALSRVLARDIGESYSYGEAVAEVTTTVDDLNRKLAIYSDQLFRQARWEADLFKADLMAELPIAQAFPLAERGVKSAESAMASLDRLASAIEHVVGVAEGAPKLITAEREAAIKTMQSELTRTIDFAQQERIAALKELHEAMVAERLALTQDVEQISLKMVDHAMTRLQRLVVVVLAMVILAAFLGLLLVRQIFFRRPLELRHEHPSNSASQA